MSILYQFQGSVCSDLRKVNNFLSETIINLEQFLSDEEIIYDVRLIISELVVNGALHGNELNEEKKVYLGVVIDDNRIKISVKDEGCGIAHDIKSVDCQSYKCSGRGLFIVDSIADNLVFQGNEATAIKRIV